MFLTRFSYGTMCRLSVVVTIVCRMAFIVAKRCNASAI